MTQNSPAAPARPLRLQNSETEVGQETASDPEALSEARARKAQPAAVKDGPGKDGSGKDGPGKASARPATARAQGGPPKPSGRPGKPAAQPAAARPAAAQPAAAKAQGGPAKPSGRPGKPDAQSAIQVVVRPPAQPAKVRRRHRGMVVSFVLLVLVPTAMIATYLYYWATDQYASTVGFSVRTEEMGSAVEILGGLTDLSGSSSSDTDILYEYIQSQELVARIDDKLDLRRIYSFPQDDPVFTFDPSGAIEDLVSYWGRMVRINYDGGTGLIELRVLAFRPGDAQAIAREIFVECSRMINELSAIARDDATRYAREELDHAVERLKSAREAVTAYRSRTRIVDPNADIQGQMGLLNIMEQQLAEAMIELGVLREITREGDPRIAQAEVRISVIQKRIDEERLKFGDGGQGRGGEDYATLIADFERLLVDREFAEETYKLALTNFDVSQAEAQRQSRYLAAYVKPTLAQSSQFPQREIITGLSLLFLFLGWAIAVLIYYSVRDRR